MSAEQRTKFCKKIPAVIASKLEFNDIDIKDFCAKVGINQKTFYNRRKSPGDFTVNELLTIANYFNGSIYELLGKEDVV